MPARDRLREKKGGVATGHAMKGISMAPVTGKLAAQLAAAERPDITLSARHAFLQNLPQQTFDFTANMVMRMPL